MIVYYLCNNNIITIKDILLFCLNRRKERKEILKKIKIINIKRMFNERKTITIIIYIILIINLLSWFQIDWSRRVEYSTRVGYSIRVLTIRVQFLNSKSRVEFKSWNWRIESSSDLKTENRFEESSRNRQESDLRN